MHLVRIVFVVCDCGVFSWVTGMPKEKNVLWRAICVCLRVGRGLVNLLRGGGVL